MIHAVLDTNLLISYLLTHRPPIAALIDDYLAREHFVLLIGAALLKELDRVLCYPRSQRHYTEETRTQFVALIAAVELPQSVPRIGRDPSDDRMIACTVAGQADAIVSGDRDLLALGAKKMNIPGLSETTIRRQVYSILHSLDHMRRSEAYWHVSRIVNRVRQMLKQAQDLVKAGDVTNALVFLEAITDEYIKGWGILDDSDGDVGGFFVELGDAWEEAVLAADLSPAEREEWKRKLVHWQEEISGYELDSVFEVARMMLDDA